MDLLAAYGSDSDSIDSGDDGPKSKPTPSSSTLSTTQKETTQSSSSSLKEAAATKAKKRGKKMLKLSAVLPEHIWNQLTGAATTAGGFDGFDADSSGEEDSDDEHDTKKRAAKNSEKPQMSLDFSATSKTATAKDSGLQSLMQELSKSKAAAAPLTAKASDDVSPSAAAADEPAVPPSSLGFAFVTSTVETTKRKRSGDDQVRDIHADAAAAPKPPPHSSPKGTPAKLSSSSSSSTVPHPTPSVPRPSASRTVPHRPAAPMPLNRSAAPATTYQHQTSAAPSHIGPTASHSGGGGKKKLSRKRQMEQILRAGKLDQVEGDHVVEGVASTYQPTEADSGPSYNSHGVRVVPTSSYNVSTGSTTASTEITGRQRNKHQLNSLLASAASLEAQRAQNPHFTGRTTGTSHRATAKRKYGW